MTLSPDDIERFIVDGYLRIDHAFPREIADAGRAILWRAAQVDPENPATWTQPVVRIPGLALPPFVAAANTPKLHAAVDALVGAGRWTPLQSLGGFVVRFPWPDDPGDTGWHIDVSFPPPGNPGAGYFDWRANAQSKGRALLMLFLLSDVTEDDAPTRISVGSHIGMTQRLAPYGEGGVSLMDLVNSSALDVDVSRLPQAHAVGPAGTVYLCHPHLVHAAQPLRAGRPRFLAQPALLPAPGPTTTRSPVEQAIDRALA